MRTTTCYLRASRVSLAAALSIVSIVLTGVASAEPLRTESYVGGLTRPVAFVQDPSHPTLQFVVEQGGRIRAIQNGGLVAAPFLDITPSVASSGEQGLLGLAFAPDYASSGRFFIYFTRASGDIVVARYRRSASNPLVADPSSRFDLLWSTGVRYIEHSAYANHNGGNLAFGPDGYLYLGTGDGGGAGDPQNNAQSDGSLLGKMLRIDVNVPDSDPEGFDVPADNPFLGAVPAGARPEIWAIGLRNPWRWSFDDPARGGTGALLIGDIGEHDREELNYEPANRGGRNYGWSVKEGSSVYPGGGALGVAAFSPLTDPLFELDTRLSTSIIGGFVYRGARLGAEYAGRYFFADFATGRVYSVALGIGADGNATASDFTEHAIEPGDVGTISAFGVDSEGELYIVSWSSGEIRRLVPMDAPLAATLVSPSGIIATITPAYTWNAVSGSEWYYLWVTDQHGIRIQQWYTAAAVGCASGAGTCSVTSSIAVTPGEAWWWIQTWNADGYGPWSEFLTFAPTPPAQVTTVSPSGSIATAFPTYTWTASPLASHYFVWVDNVGSGRVLNWFTAATAGCATGTGTCAVTPNITLVPGPATWWVQPYNEAGYGTWSVERTFSVDEPGAATLVSPTGTITTATPAYTWNAVPGALQYMLWVDNQTVGRVLQWYTAAALGCPGGTGTCSITPSTPLVSGAGTWWVQTWNEAGYGPWSASLSFTVSLGPVFTSAAATTFTVGSAGTFAVTAVDSPAPAITLTTGALPTGVTYVDNGTGSGTLSGTPAAGTGGSYALVFTASNGVSSPTTQNFTLTVQEPPSFTSAAAATFTIGAAGSFSVTTLGFPRPTLAAGGAALPSGVTFVDNGNGTATLSGTPAAGTGGTYALTFTASNGIGGNVVQNFTLTVSAGPTITSASTTTFTVGSLGTFTVTTTGSPTPAISVTGVLPTGVTFTDNGDGTGTLAGTPGAATGGSYALTFTASNGVLPNGTQAFTLNVNQAPAITSANATTFTVGTAGLFNVVMTGFPAPTVSVTAGTLPAGVTLSPAGVLSGTPDPGTGGVYNVTFTATNGIGADAVQAFTLTVNQAPAITSANTATFLLNTAGTTFQVVMTGIPAPTVSVTSGTLPTGLTLSSAGLLSGTPTQSGSFPVTLTATNGTLPNATQAFTVLVNAAPAITSANATTFIVGTAGSFNVVMTGFPAPTVSVTAGTLPAGVTLSPAGILSGTPDPGTGGVHNVTFTATNGIGSDAVQAFTLTVNQAPAITSATTATFLVNTAGTTFQVVMTGFPAPTVSVTAGTLPTGLTLSSGGTLSGTPTQSGSFPVTLTATNGTLPNATQAFTVAVNAPPAITSGNADTFTVGTADSFTVTTTGFPTPTVTHSGGTLPSGVTFTSATRVLAGTATQTGAFPLVFTAANGVPPDATQNFTLNVVCPAITVTPAVMPDGLYLTAYAGVDFNQAGSTGSTFTWAATGLPAGLSIDISTGVVSGTPTNTVLAGAVVVTVTDNFGCVGTRNTTLTIRPTTDNENYIGGVGHTQYVVGAAIPSTPHVLNADATQVNVKIGDNGPGTLTVTFPATSLNGVIVEGATDGTFTYTPNLNFAGPSDGFTYTLTDGNGVTNTGTVTINLSNLVWYVNATGGNGDGRSHNPFNTLASAGTASAANSIIYVHSDAAQTTPGNLTMDANQTLYGQGAVFALNNLTIAAGTRPDLGGTVTLADNTTVTAVNFTGPSGMSAAGVTQPIAIDQVTVTGGSNALSLANVSGAVTVTNATFTNSTGAEVLINQGTGNVSIAAVISSNAGRSIDIQNRTGGIVTFTGAITDTGQGIFLNANTGSTINFTGGLALTTGGNPGFTATNGGTVSATQNNTTIVNTITTTTGTALNVANTTIGASGLTFRSITAGTGAGSAGNGLVLDNTGTAAGNGGLTVTGNAAAGTGGTIQHKTGANGSTAQGIGIYLNQTKNASFSFMQLNDFDNFAIRGNEVNGLTLTNVVVSGLNGNDAGSDEGSVLVEDSGGTIAITNSNISGGFEDNLRVDYNNAVAGPAATFTVSGSTFRDLQAAGQNAQVNLRSQTSASSGWVAAFNFTSNTFENDANTLPPGGTENWSDGILVTFEGPFAHDLTVQNSTFHHLFQGMDIASNFSADVDYVIRNNNITFTEGVAAIAIGNGSSSTAQSFLTALIQGNTIGTSGVAQSGSRLGQGIVVDVRGEETAQFTIHGNTIRRIDVGGIDVLANTGDGDLHIQITDNVIEQVEDDVGAGISDGMRVLTATGSLHDICLDARNNDSFNISADDLQLRQSNAGVVFAIEGLTGSGTSTANVEAFLDGQNPLFTPASGGTRVRTVASVVNFTSVASCTTPNPQ